MEAAAQTRLRHVVKNLEVGVPKMKIDCSLAPSESVCQTEGDGRRNLQENKLPLMLSRPFFLQEGFVHNGVTGKSFWEKLMSDYWKNAVPEDLCGLHS